MALLLGDDGRGYELARKLESHGVWRSWLGDSYYSAFLHFLSSSTSWEAFMRADDNKTRAQLHLQLRARALLFDKASISLFLRSNQSSSSSSTSSISSISITKLNPNYLQLHGDDVYFTLDNSSQDAAQSVPANSSSSSKSKSAFGARYGESESDPMSLRFKLDELPETWYAQFFEKYKASKSYRVSFGDQETEKRTPEQMSIYLRVLEKHKRRRIAFREDQHMGFGNSALENGPNIRSNFGDESNAADDEPFFPETMFSMNCVPDRAVLRTTYVGDNPKVKFNGVLDTLPQVMTKSPVISPIMIERLGIRPEYLSMEQGGSQSRGMNVSGGSKKLLSEEQASQMSQKVIARFLSNMGFEASSEVPLEVFAQLLSCHIRKLGRTLKLLADSYRKQCSAIELLKMFFHTAGHSNLAALSELVKDNTRSSVQQAQQQIQGIQSQLQLQQQASIRQSQIARQIHPQMQQMINSQNVAFQQQQQLERMRRRQQATPRPGMSMNMNTNMNMNMGMNTNMNMNTDQERPMVQVKIENPSDFPIDNNAFNALNSRQAQLQQFRQQQLAAMSSLHAQPNNQFRPVGSPQIPQMHSPNTGMVRAPPVKVEGFQELMGGDATLKHDSEENKLTSPSK